MASKRFGKDSIEFKMFGDYWKLCQMFWIPEDADNDTYYDQARDAFLQFAEKYKGVEGEFSSQLSIAFFNYLEKRYKEEAKAGK